ncbi:MAG TPA: AzlD domain-containing protein [Candidatus Anaerobiospirillum stercoravium]|nr:AzlD domain-containing protein [Candidatus Anaerobiospirillum stercoravium]
MLPSYLDLLAIAGMASATYFTRICGFLWLKKHQLSPRARAVLESSPCCVMVSVVAPSFITTDPKTLVALLCSVGLSFKCSLGVTIVLSVIIMALLQNLL